MKDSSNARLVVAMFLAFLVASLVRIGIAGKRRSGHGKVDGGQEHQEARDGETKPKGQFEVAEIHIFLKKAK
jgi:hypothetical protein